MIKGILIWLLGLVVLGLITYGGYQLTKSLSYEWWYEDMVKETIKQMVKPEYLKEVK